MTWNCVNLEKSMVSYERIQKIMEIQTEKFDEGQWFIDWWPWEGWIEFKDYKLRYWPDTELVLKGISISIQPWEKIGIVGRTGAGKSTICLALCWMIEAMSGQIIIDDADISWVELGFLRSKITIIPQDPTIFEGSLWFNFDPDLKSSDEEIMRLIKESCLENLVLRDPKGLEQQI